MTRGDAETAAKSQLPAQTLLAMLERLGRQLKTSQKTGPPSPKVDFGQYPDAFVFDFALLYVCVDWRLDGTAPGLQKAPRLLVSGHSSAW